MFDGIDVTIGSVGDSRAYWVVQHDAVRLTSDDSLASEREARGEPPLPITDPLAHAITKWIGAGAPETEPEIISHRPDEHGHLVLCTDGLWHHLRTSGELAALVRRAGARGPSAIAQLLVDRALAEGGQDNVTVAVAAVTPERTGRAT
jgi:serine/threonine protein phosphatase PrpC